MATVFIVDDDLSIVKLTKLLLEGSGFQVIGTAANGQIAVSKIISLSEKLDFVIMDYRMPIMDGIEATREILKIIDHLKIIFATADEDIKEQALKVGAIAVVNKPFNFDELLTTINDFSIENTIWA